jgi:hypothetical protein
VVIAAGSHRLTARSSCDAAHCLSTGAENAMRNSLSSRKVIG